MVFSVNVPDELVAWADQHAAKLGLSRSALISSALRVWRLNVETMSAFLADPVLDAALRECFDRSDVWDRLAALNVHPPKTLDASPVKRRRPYSRGTLPGKVGVKVVDSICQHVLQLPHGHDTKPEEGATRGLHGPAFPDGGEVR